MSTVFPLLIVWLGPESPDKVQLDIVPVPPVYAIVTPSVPLPVVEMLDPARMLIVFPFVKILGDPEDPARPKLVKLAAGKVIVDSLIAVTWPVEFVDTLVTAAKVPPKAGDWVLLVSVLVVLSWLTVGTGPVEFATVI